jgi:hypothetical protein
MVYCSHCHRVTHLLMELWICLGWREAALRQKIRVIQIDGA